VTRWIPPTGFLGSILSEARARAAALRGRAAELERAADFPAAPSFSAGLAGDTVAIIAEVKRRSPSKGTINARLSARDQAREYEKGGAKGVSVLTEPRHFGGSERDLTEVLGVISLPVLKKDFHVDPLQVLEARSLGASALLLIARALRPEELTELTHLARTVGVEPFIEVRDERELERALAAGGALVGINNRNLETLVIDEMTSERLIPLIPPGVLAVAESGVSVPGDIARAAAAGADAVLVGSSLAASSDPAEAVRALGGVARVPRGR
jgi:indole-3-glycerol phosphate synthase